MSKTVDDLVKVFMQAADDTYAAEYIDPADTTNVAWRAGIAAVVRALRDELSKCDWDEGENMIDALDEILGDAGNEKVAGVSVGNGETELDRTSGPAPATDPAPAVCVWTDVGDKYRSACGRSHFAWTSRDGVVVCPHCKAPIKFTEVQK